MSLLSDSQIPEAQPWAERSLEQGPSAIGGQLSSAASLDPSVAYGQENEWPDIAASQERQPQALDTGSDVGSDVGSDSDALLFSKVQQDSFLSQDVMEFDRFNPNHNQYVDPSLIHPLPKLYPDQSQASSFGVGTNPKDPWEIPSPPDHMDPPEINIDFAPPSRVSPFMRTDHQGDALSPPDRSRSRNRIRAKSDALSSIAVRSQSAEGVDALRAKTASAQFSAPPPSLHSPQGISHWANDSELERTPKHSAPFQCSLCPKRFSRAYNLRSHLRTHTDEHPFICSVCGKAFKRQHDRKMHQRLHPTVPKSKYAYTYGSDDEFSASENKHAGDTRAREEQIAILRAGWAAQVEEGDSRSQSINESGTFMVDAPRREYHSYALPGSPPAPVPSDSGYRSGLGTDTESVCSLGSVGSSFGLPADFLQEFIAFFGDTLIEKSGAQRWTEHALAVRSPDEIETRLTVLLKEYSMELTSNPPKLPTDSKRIQQVQHSVDGQALAGAARLIRRYRPKIARYFRDNAVSASASTASLSERLQQLGQQLSLTERLGLFSKPTPNTDDTTETMLDVQMDEDDEGVADLALVQELLVSCRAFDRLALSLRRTLSHDDGLQMANVRTWVSEGIQNTACGAKDAAPSPPEVGYIPHHLARFDVNWSIVEFMRSQYGTKSPNIGAVVTLTGSALYAQATTCAEYVKTTWPNSGPAFLELLEAGLSKLQEEQRTKTSVSVKIEQGL